MELKINTLLEDLIRLANDNSKVINDALKLCEEFKEEK